MRNRPSVFVASPGPRKLIPITAIAGTASFCVLFGVMLVVMIEQKISAKGSSLYGRKSFHWTFTEYEYSYESEKEYKIVKMRAVSSAPEFLLI